MKLRTFPASLAVLVVAIAVVDFVAHEYYWYRLFTWFDMMMHFAGGAWLAGVAVWWYQKKHDFGVALSLKTLFFVGVGFAVAVGTLWEGYEAVVGVVVEGHANALRDTLSDIMCDTFGALVAVLVVVRKRLML